CSAACGRRPARRGCAGRCRRSFTCSRAGLGRARGRRRPRRHPGGEEPLIAAGETLRGMREHKPLVHQITNYVVMNETANATLALGALPVMAHAGEEVEEMARIASSLVLNIGTLSRHWIDSMVLAGAVATERGIPVVLDPVGAGATTFRTETSRHLLDVVG